MLLLTWNRVLGSTQSRSLVGRQAGQRRKESGQVREHPHHTPGLGRQNTRSAQVTEVHFSEPFCPGFWVEVHGVSGCAGPGPTSWVTADLGGCWALLSSGHQQVPFLGEGTWGQTSLEAETPQCLRGGTLDSGQSVLECDSGAKILSC